MVRALLSGFLRSVNFDYLTLSKANAYRLSFKFKGCGLHSVEAFQLFNSLHNRFNPLDWVQISSGDSRHFEPAFCTKKMSSDFVAYRSRTGFEAFSTRLCKFSQSTGILKFRNSKLEFNIHLDRFKFQETLQESLKCLQRLLF